MRSIGLIVAVALSGCGGGTPAGAIDMGGSDGAAMPQPGPLAAGYHLAQPLPSAAVDPNAFGGYLSMVLDGNGDPALAYVWYDLANSGSYDNSALFFTRWDRTAGRWTAPVKVDSVGNIHSPGVAASNVSLAYDSSNGVFGIAYAKLPAPTGYRQVQLALSTTNGASFTTSPVTVAAGVDFDEPALALARGVAHVVYNESATGVRYRSGPQAMPPSSWPTQFGPSLPAGATASTDCSPAIAIDPTGVAAIAYAADSGSNKLVAFFRMSWIGMKGSQVAWRGQDEGNGGTFVSLAFDGANPRIVSYGAVAPDTTHTLWFAASADDGSTWMPQVAIPQDGATSMGQQTRLAIGPAHQAAIVSEKWSGSTSESCDQPKLAQSTNGATWTTCGLSPLTAGVEVYSAYVPDVRFGSDGKLYVTFQQTLTTSTAAPGIYVWHQP